MNSALFYLASSGMLCVLLWVPYILNRVFVCSMPRSIFWVFHICELPFT